MMCNGVGLVVSVTIMRLVLALLVLGSCALDDVTPTTADRAGPPPGQSSSLVAGTRSLVVQTTPDASHCGGANITVRQTATRDVLEPEFVAAMTLEPLSGLDFTADQAASNAHLNAFLRDAMAKVQRAAAIYAARIADHGASAEVHASALARKVQLLRRLGDALEHAEIPKDLRSGELAIDKTNAYCDVLAATAQPLFEKAEAAAARCREQATAPGWWTTACAAR